MSKFSSNFNNKKAQALFLSLFLFPCLSIAHGLPENGFHGLVVSHLAFQKADNKMVRGLEAPTMDDMGNIQVNPVIADSSGRLQNALIASYTHNNWTGTVNYLDLRSIGDAYSLTNPFSYGVNTFNSYDFPKSIKTVDYLSGIYELNLNYINRKNSLTIGKIDTSLHYLSDPVFAGDLTNGVDYGNAATRVVAPPFPSLAVVGKHYFTEKFSLTMIIGDAFGDREDLDAGKNLAHGDAAYIIEGNYFSPNTHLQFTLNHIDDFNKMDKGVVSHNAATDAALITGSHWVDKSFAYFGRIGLSDGDDVQENLNVVAGMKYKFGKWSVLASQSATRVAKDQGSSNKGDFTLVSELTLNYDVTSSTSVGLMYDHYSTTGNVLLAKDGGLNSNNNNNVFGIRFTHFYKI
ncbi:hypothetical protein L1D34_21825 [Vibrio mediterranei]|uniref:hypothetical protein n=1 Tax=Vibrio mediterranei TaxID=689 RepID=UPI001EFCD799|nr:hypothetical protein [Vibrio mediterranei]MCG9627476.1 hypothetical protein [Vibrio mediterranei]